MGRVEHYDDPSAPAPNTLIPASNMLAVNASGQILMQRRRDTGQWALPGGAQELGETPAECAVRECEEETGVRTEVTGLLGVYSDPRHIVAYTDGEVRQEYEVTCIGRPLAGVPTETDEASASQWFSPESLGKLDIHPTMRRQINDYLGGNLLHVD